MNDDATGDEDRGRTPGEGVDGQPRWPAMMTWAGVDAPRLETTRVQLTSRGLKASGRIVGGACAAHPAFSADYDLLLDDTGVTRRLSMRATTVEGEREVSLKRGSEGFWLLDDGTGPRRAEFDGAKDVDVVLSPLFNTLAVRRLAMSTTDVDVSIPVVYVTLPSLQVSAQAHHYRSVAGRISSTTPLGDVDITVDDDGFVLDYPGLARRA